MSAMTVLRRELRAIFARYVPASTPMGEPIRMPSSVITPLPYQRIEQPTLAAGRRGHLREQAPGHAREPCDSRVHKIAAKQQAASCRDQRQHEKGAVFSLCAAPVDSYRESPAPLQPPQHAWAAAITVKVMRNSSNPTQ